MRDARCNKLSFFQESSGEQNSTAQHSTDRRAIISARRSRRRPSPLLPAHVDIASAAPSSRAQARGPTSTRKFVHMFAQTPLPQASVGPASFPHPSTSQRTRASNPATKNLELSTRRTVVSQPKPANSFPCPSQCSRIVCTYARQPAPILEPSSALPEMPRTWPARAVVHTSVGRVHLPGSTTGPGHALLAVCKVY